MIQGSSSDKGNDRACEQGGFWLWTASLIKSIAFGKVTQMKWGKWFLRILLLVLVAGAAAGYWTYHTWTNPRAVRHAVLAELSKRLPGIEARMESAEFRWFGGVRIQKLSLARRDDPSTAVAFLPEIVCYPDRDRLARGVLELRKIEIERPRLVVTRRPDGSWNLTGLGSPPQDGGSTPEIAIHDGTLLFVDQSQAGCPLQLTNIDMKIVPGQSARLQINLSCDSDIVGKFLLEGSLDPDSGELAMTFRIPEVQLQVPIVQRLLDAFGGVCERPPELEGIAAVEGTFTHHPDAPRPWHYAARVTLHQGHLRHHRLPVPLEQLEVTAVLEDGSLRLEQLEGIVHGGRLSVTGDGAMAAEGFRGEFDVHVSDFAVSADLYDKLPPQSRKFCYDFRPRGTVALSGTLTVADGNLDVPRYKVHPKDLSLLFIDFPYPVEHVTGALSFEAGRDDTTLQLQLAGMANRRPVAIKGKLFGNGLRLGCDWKPGIDLEISGDDIAIDDKFYRALEPYKETLKVAHEFHPKGLVNVRAEIRRPAATGPAQKPRPSHHITLRFHDAAFQYDAFPYPQEAVTGTLELWLPGENWRFHEFTGKHQGGSFSGWAASSPSSEGRTLTIDIQGRNVMLDREVEGALDREMKEAWQHFRPNGRVDCRVVFKQLGDAKPDLQLGVVARGCNMKPSCFPYQLGVAQGSFAYANHRITVKDLDAWHGSSHVTLEQALVDLNPQGGARSQLRNLRADPITVDADFLEALPKLVRTTFATLRPDQPIRLVLTDLIVSDSCSKAPAQYFWDGHLACANCGLHCGVDLTNVTGLAALRGSHDGKRLQAKGNLVLARATLAKQPFHDVFSELRINDNVLYLDGLRAELHGGEVNSPLFQVQFGDHVNYWLKLVGSKIDLQHFAQEGLDRKGQVRGTADAELTLSGQGDDLSKLQGQGWIKIPNGARLYDLPLVIDLLTFLSGKLPRGSAFQEASGEFIIDGERLRVSKLELLGDALSLRGEGEMQVNGGGLNLEMYGLLWGRQLPLLPPILDQIPPAISKRLMKIRVQGSLSSAQVNTEPLPIVMEPLKSLWQRLQE
jgi:hypothetical protein